MMQSQLSRWHAFASAEALQGAAAEAVLSAAERALATRGRFDLVLAGGTTPRVIYEKLRSAEADWSGWHIWFGDERCLPVDDAERNSRMAYDAWLSHVAIPAVQIHPIPAELGAMEGAAAYNTQLADVGSFDLVLLGLGEDAHTASLFPGHSWDHSPPMAAIPVKHAPKPPADRVSLSASRLSDAKEVIFLVTGAGKRHAVAQWRGTPFIPVKAITPAAGVDIYVDAAAGAPL